MLQRRDPGIMLFGQKITFPTHPYAPVGLYRELSSPAITKKEEDEEELEETDQDAIEETENLQSEQNDDNSGTNSTDMDDEDIIKPEAENSDKEQSNSPEKSLKKPDKILPCPRCKSMDTKFCYYNNYNVNQPRHFCKACQRYWTAGGIMRNVPVGAGRRKNKISGSDYRHISIIESLHAARIDAPKSNGTVLRFGLDAVFSDSRPVTNRDDCSSMSSVTVSNEEEEKNCKQETVLCLSGVPWHYPWNRASPVSGFCSPGFTLPLYQAGYWGIPYVPTTLGKHARDINRLNPSNHDENQPPNQKNRYVLVPKTLRIDDPSEAAKSSIWTTLGIKHEPGTGEGLFKGFQQKGNVKNHPANTCHVLQANPAALCRSFNFRESA